MLEKYSFTVVDRFLRYVKIDTQSDPHSNTYPSTEKQKDLGRLLISELNEMGISNAELDEFGYVYATLPSNTDKEVPVICFCSHMDTSPDCSGANVKPLIHSNYQGEDLVLPDDPTQILKQDSLPYLSDQIGNDIITASGTTLLGADNKAGVAEIMDMLHFFQQYPEIKHGKLRILFTTDEEIARGTDKVGMEKLGADFGYTVDGEAAGSLEAENFSADGVYVEILGVSAHPGLAKGKMVNAMKVAAEFLGELPKENLSPETSEGKAGFIHPVHMHGTVDKAILEFIIRDFEDHKLSEYEQLMRDKLDLVLTRYPGSKANFRVEEQYRNMKNILQKHPQVTEFAEEAIRLSGLTPVRGRVRGGTDGARLSYMGLPCPNIFAGEHAFHSKLEWVSVQDMQKAVSTLVHLVGLWEKNS